jgi:hypothetical protein
MNEENEKVPVRLTRHFPLLTRGFKTALLCAPKVLLFLVLLRAEGRRPIVDLPSCST